MKPLAGYSFQPGPRRRSRPAWSDPNRIRSSCAGACPEAGRGWFGRAGAERGGRCTSSSRADPGRPGVAQRQPGIAGRRERGLPGNRDRREPGLRGDDARIGEGGRGELDDRRPVADGSPGGEPWVGRPGAVEPGAGRLGPGRLVVGWLRVDRLGLGIGRIGAIEPGGADGVTAGSGSTGSGSAGSASSSQDRADSGVAASRSANAGSASSGPIGSASSNHRRSESIAAGRRAAAAVSAKPGPRNPAPGGSVSPRSQFTPESCHTCWASCQLERCRESSSPATAPGGTAIPGPPARPRNASVGPTTGMRRDRF